MRPLLQPPLDTSLRHLHLASHGQRCTEPNRAYEWLDQMIKVLLLNGHFKGAVQSMGLYQSSSLVVFGPWATLWEPLWLDSMKEM